MLFIFSTGYGDITPQTPTGQILCIIVSLFGIPITLLTLNSAGELIAKLISKTLTKFEKKVLKRAEPQKVETKTAVILVVLMAMVMVMAGMSAEIARDRKISNWTFVEGVYFWFITFSTIGFGDYLFEKHGQRIYHLHANNSTYQENEDDLFQASDVASGILFILIYMTCLLIVSGVINSIMAAMEEHKCRPRCPGCVPHKTEDHVNSEQHHGQDTTGVVLGVLEQ